MAGVYKLEISESEEDLKRMLRTQKTASDKKRIQLLYLLKTKQAQSSQHQQYWDGIESHYKIGWRIIAKGD